MRFKATRFLLGASAVTGAIFVASTAGAITNTSSWSDKVGFVLGDDSTTWCETSLTATGAKSSFTLVPSDSAVKPTHSVMSNVAQQTVRVQCSFLGITTVVAAPGWSSDPTDSNSVNCPTGWTPNFAECSVRGQIDNGSAVTLPYVYEGSACGAGIPSINGAATLISELLDSSNSGFLTYQPWPTLPSVSPLGMPNNTGAPTNIGGADLGSVFLAGGILNYAFGDSFTTCTIPAPTQQVKNPMCAPSGFTGWHPGTIARSTNLDPTSGVTLQAWDLDKNGAVAPIFAPQKGEASVIAGAGFAVTPANGPGESRFIWYFSVQEWGSPANPQGVGQTPFLANGSGLAMSIGGATGPATNGPKTGWDRSAGPRWPPTSNFGPGAIWQDRYNQVIYFFGVRPQLGPWNDTSTNSNGQHALPYSGIRVAKVASNVNAILDPMQYQYWNGSTWVAPTDPNNPYAPAIPTDEGGLFGTAADLIPATNGILHNYPRSEISVAFDSYANRWIMMLLNTYDPGIRLFQSPAITGPWNEVYFDTYALPYLASVPVGVPSPGVYAPFLSDHLMTSAGSDVYFLLSEWTPMYNVGTWHMNLNRNTSCSLTP